MKTFVETPQINSSKEIENTTCTNLLGLYRAIEQTIEKSNGIQEIKNNDILDSLRNRAGNYLYVTPKGLDQAIHNWGDFRTMHNICLPLSLEDEIALVFYIYICHDTNKQERIKTIFTSLGNTKNIAHIESLCLEQVTSPLPIKEDF